MMLSLEKSKQNPQPGQIWLVSLVSKHNVCPQEAYGWQYISIVLYHDMRQDMVTDFRYRYIVIFLVLSFSVWKGFITVKWCDFLNLPDCSRCSFIVFYPLGHITDDYSSKMSLGQYFVKSPVVILTILSQCRGIWSKILWYLLILSP